MQTFRVLFLEDIETDKPRVLSALEQEDFFYTYKNNWEEAAQFLESEQYDLVIADIYIYENKLQASLKTKAKTPGEFDCLEKLLEITEAADPPIPVVIYTGQSSMAILKPFRDRIADFWDKKQVTDPDFLAFRIRKIRDLIEYERPSSPLIKSLKTALDNNLEVPWRDDINRILCEYESYSSPMDQGLVVQSPLARIASSLGLSANFKDGFDVALRSDSPISITLGSRPHFHHSINCFLLGYYLFNLAGIDWIKIFTEDDNSYFSKRLKSNFSTLEPEAAQKKVWQEINSSWFAASLLHDCTSVIQRFPKIMDHYTKLAGKLKLCKPAGDIEKFIVKDELASQATIRLKPTSPNISEYILKISDKTDHGYASGVFILTHCFDEVVKNRKDPEFLIPAAEAVYLHNFSTKSDFPVISINASPVAGMLMFCDAIQSWKRDLPESELEYNEIITKAELTELTANVRHDGQPSIKIRVRYLPPAFIAKHKQTIDKNENILLEVLQKYVKDPIRQKIIFGFKHDTSPEINVKFYVGHKIIEEVNIPEEEV